MNMNNFLSIHTIKILTDLTHGAHSRMTAGGDHAYEWVVDNKYYSATVQLCPVVKAQVEPAFASSVAAFVLLVPGPEV